MSTTIRKISSDTKAHRQSVDFQISDIASYLQEHLGQKLVALMTDVDPKTVARWVDSASHPRPEAEQRLRTAFQVFHLLQNEESPHTVRAWFVGLNPQLHDDSPAIAIRDMRLKDVMVAARAYAAGG